MSAASALRCDTAGARVGAVPGVAEVAAIRPTDDTKARRVTGSMAMACTPGVPATVARAIARFARQSSR